METVGTSWLPPILAGNGHGRQPALGTATSQLDTQRRAAGIIGAQASEGTMDAALQRHIEDHLQEYVEDLKRLCRQPSVAAILDEFGKR